MEKIALRIFLYVLIASGVVFAFVRMAESRMIFFPSRDMAGSPADIGAPFESVRIGTADGVTIAGWYVPAPAGADPPVVLFLHGNAGNISHRLEKLGMLRDAGAAVLLVDYRGYGQSGGSPSEKGAYLDADAAYRWLVQEKKVPTGRIVVYGESLGGAVAIELASRVPVGGLIVDSSFTSVPDMAAHALPFTPRFMLATRMDSLGRIRAVRAPKLVLHSVNDEIVPFRMGRALFDAAPEPKTLLPLKGGHNTNFVDSEKEYRRGLEAFLAPLTNVSAS